MPGKSTFTLSDKPRLVGPKFATVEMLDDHIRNGGGFVSRGKALRYLCWEHYVPKKPNPDGGVMNAGPGEKRIRSVWIINDDGSRSTENGSLVLPAADVASRIALTADVDHGGNAWRFSFVDLEYT